VGDPPCRYGGCSIRLRSLGCCSGRSRWLRVVKDLPGWKAVSLDCGHDAMVDDPAALAALLLEEPER